MRRWIPVLAIVLGLQVILAIALGTRGERLAPLQSNAALVAADLKAVDRLVLDGPLKADAAANATADKPKVETARLEIVKRDGRWLLPSYHDAPADAVKVQALLDRLTTTQRGLPVAKTADARQRFKVADTAYERRVVASVGDKPAAVVYVGDSPGLRRSHARTAQDEVVYSVELPMQELPTIPVDWLDTGLLKLDPAALSEIGISSREQGALTLTRNVAKDKDKDKVKDKDRPAEPAWQVIGLPAGKRLDEARVTTLLNTITGLRVDAVIGTDPKPDWQPELTLALKTGPDPAATWTLFKPKTGDDYVLRASGRPWYLELKKWNAQPLLDAVLIDKLVVAATPGQAASAPIAAAGKVKK